MVAKSFWEKTKKKKKKNDDLYKKVLIFKTKSQLQWMHFLFIYLFIYSEKIIFKFSWVSTNMWFINVFYPDFCFM